MKEITQTILHGDPSGTPGNCLQNEKQLLVFADIVMDQSAHAVSRGPRDIALTPTEWALLEMFMRHPRQVLSRRQLLAEVWDIRALIRTNTLDVHIGYLRRKTEGGGGSRLIHTVRGAGYVLRETPPGGEAS